MNISFITHYPRSDGKFGCSRRCAYCNWQRLEAKQLILESKPSLDLLDNTLKGFSPDVKDRIKTITVSGGGDPLFSEDAVFIPEHTLNLVKGIIARGYNARVITRELWGAYLLIQDLTKAELQKFSLSISIDYKSIKEPIRHIAMFDAISKYIDEFTIVPGAVFSADWVLNYVLPFDKDLKALGSAYKFNLTIRENLRSTLSFPKEEVHDALKFINTHLYNLRARWLPKSVCLEKNLYLISPMPVFNNNEVLDGLDMTIDFERLADFFCTDKACILYGGAARSRLVASKHLWRDDCNWEFNDYDVFVLSEDVKRILKHLSDQFGFQIEASYKKDNKDRRFVLRRKVDPTFKIVLYVVETLDIAWTIISEAAVGFNRFGYHKGAAVELEGFSLDDLLNNKARILPHKWKYLNMEHRNSAEGNQLKKLKLKGCEIIPLTSAGKFKQKLFNLIYRIKHGN